MSSILDTLQCQHCIENRGWDPVRGDIECPQCLGSGLSLKAPSVARIIDYEDGLLSPGEVIVLFARLRRSGMLRSLQGSYRRSFESLLEAGLLDDNGVPTDYCREWLIEVERIAEEV